MTAAPEPAVTDTFHGPCLECGATVHTVGGTVQPHECKPTESRQAAIATAYWNGHDAAANSGIATADTTRVLDDVQRERERQVEKGWTPEHDDEHDTDTLVRLAERYARRSGKGRPPGCFDRHRLVQATALLVAAIEAMDRRAAR